MSIKTKIRKAIKDFFQYEKEGDKKLLKKILSKVKIEDNYVIIREERVKVEKEDDAVGVFLANIPYIIIGKGELHWDLPEKVVKVQRGALRLLDCGINDVATLEIYLVMEMALRSLYSEYVKQGVIIQYKDKKVKLKDYDYRRIKLYIRRKGWSQYKVKVNGETFPFSQGSLLSWAEKFMDKEESLAFRLSLNVRNLLAHGEVEWDLFPTLKSLESASYISWLLFQRMKKYEVS
ncbi:hypothetical protein SJAV_16780 [Sulfurisphaera javensis]|uniref:DUF4209 domain-containing protein n=1 Tax=Sulfurisphaera javensis TaxID=2049879 RepID=A0AAT9GSC8_9CREN